MKEATTAKQRRDTLNLRIPAAERNLIDRAALSTGKTRTDFVLEAARRAAEAARGLEQMAKGLEAMAGGFAIARDGAAAAADGRSAYLARLLEGGQIEAADVAAAADHDQIVNFAHKIFNREKFVSLFVAARG